jgi:hypothetical protein
MLSLSASWKAGFFRAAMLALLGIVSIETAAAEKVTLVLGPTITIREPRAGPGDRYPLDNCYNWARRCGKDAADGYCRKKGFGASVSHKTGNRRETWVLDDQRVCRGPGCVAILEVGCAKLEGLRVEDPVISGREFRGRPLLVDNCRIWAKDCGRGGALAYCQSRNMPFVRSFRVHDKHMGATYVIGSRKICENQACRALSYVECGSTLTRSN